MHVHIILFFVCGIFTLPFLHFIKEFNLTIPDTCWLYKDFDFKKKYITSNTDYELDGDYLIAYKSCRSDGYSKFNFQFKYELNKEYECHADYNVDNGNSFGLSAWTYDKAKEYCDELIFKVKIHINDIACFVHDDYKIRCSKLKIISYTLSDCNNTVIS